MSCPLEMTQEEYDDIKTAEAVVVREYEREDGSRFACLVEHGGLEEMKIIADRTWIFIRLTGQPKIVGQLAVAVSDLLGPPQ